MTVTEKFSRKRISGSGWVNPLTHDFLLENSTYLKLYADDVQLTLGVDYSIADVGNPAGYAVTITVPGSWTPDWWVLSVETPIDQPVDISLGGSFGTRFENALDGVARRLQVLADGVRRGLKLAKDADPSVEYTIPPPESRKVIGWNEAATDLQNWSNPTDSMEQAAASAAAAAASEDAAAVSEDAAAASAAAAAVSADNADASEAAALASANLAHEFAENAEDVPITGFPALRSARHYAAKAAASFAAVIAGIAAAIHSAGASAGLQDDDEFGVADSVWSWTLAKVTWGQIKAGLTPIFLEPADVGSAAFQSSSAFAASGHTHSFASLTSKPTTVSGYGITDLGVGNAALGSGAVGTYAMLQFTTTGVARSVGSTHAGSDLQWTNAHGGSPLGNPSGTWRLCGNVPNNAIVAAHVSVFLRIS